MVEAKVEDLLTLLAGTAPTTTATECRPDQPLQAATLTTTDLVDPVDGYWTVVLVMAKRFVEGRQPLGI